MIVLTGGAGMIGSMIAWHLNTILNENNFVIFDDLTSQNQEKNIAKRKFIDFIDIFKKFNNNILTVAGWLFPVNFSRFSLFLDISNS